MPTTVESRLMTTNEATIMEMIAVIEEADAVITAIMEEVTVATATRTTSLMILTTIEISRPPSWLETTQVILTIG